MPEPYSYIRQRFDSRAGQYLRNPITQWIGHSELTVLKSMLPPRKQRSESLALDFGCGTGRVTAMLLELGYSVTGYDLSEAMLERARVAMKAHPDILFTSNSQSLHGRWPLIVSLGVLDYYRDSTPLWNQWSRLLIPNGFLLVTAPNAHSPLAWFYTLFSRFTCQAYVTTINALTPPSQAAGFTLSSRKFAFPRYWWGHTMVLSFRLQAM
jgi:SAM-dependent methyltransferase